MKKWIWIGGLGLIMVVAGLVALLLPKTSTPPPSQTPETAIKRGLEYLEKNQDKVAANQWLVMDYLQRKFDLDPQFSATRRTIQVPTNKDDAVELQIYRRIAFPNELIDDLSTIEVSPSRQMMMRAANCDHIPLPDDFEQLMQHNLDAGGYDLTHVAFSLERMKENSCAFSAEKDQKMRTQVTNGMVTLIKDPATIADLRYEAIAFLIDMGQHDQIQTTWLDQIVREQQANGGWKITLESGDTNDHATVAALWALLEYSRPNTSDEPMIRRPNQ